jgi:hypothetical protein
MPVNYENGKVYQIKCLETGKVYIGCTTKVILSARLAEHASMYRQYKKNNSNYVSSYEILEKNNYVIELIEHVPCKSRNELNTRERHFIQTIECVNRNGKYVYIPDPETELRKQVQQLNRDIYVRNYYQNWEEQEKDKCKLEPYYRAASELRKIVV